MSSWAPSPWLEMGGGWHKPRSEQRGTSPSEMASAVGRGEEEPFSATSTGHQLSACTPSEPQLPETLAVVGHGWKEHPTGRPALWPPQWWYLLLLLTHHHQPTLVT